MKKKNILFALGFMGMTFGGLAQADSALPPVHDLEVGNLRALLFGEAPRVPIHGVQEQRVPIHGVQEQRVPIKG